MWIFSKHRGEHDNRFMMNLDQCSRINLTALGEKWFIEVVMGSETIPVAQVNSQDEAGKILQEIFASLSAGDKALDLDAPSDAGDDKQKSVSPGTQK